MDRTKIRAFLVKAAELTHKALTAIWTWLSTQIYPWAKQHPVVSTVVVMTIFYLWMSARTERQREFREWPTNEQVRQEVLQSEQQATEQKPKLPEDPEERARLLAWDPNNPNTPEKYRLPAKLSDAETIRLMANLRCLVEFYQVRAGMHGAYAEIYERAAHSQEAMFDRIQSQKGFKYPEICFRWYEFMMAGSSDNVFLIMFDWLGTSSVYTRAAAIRFRIIGGKHTIGDIQFVDTAIQNVIDQYQQYEPRTRRAMQLRDWLLEEQLLFQKYATNVLAPTKEGLETPLDQWPDLQTFVDQTYRKYHGDKGNPPRIKR